MSKNTRNRILLTAVAALLLVAVTVGGTLAWLQANTEPVTNTFKPTAVSVAIDEHDYLFDTNKLDTNKLIGAGNTESDYRLIPGLTMPKDPFVTVPAGSEEVYVYVEVIKENNFDTYITSEISSDWALIDGTNVYYYKETVDTSAESATAAGPLYILSGDTYNTGEVTVKDTVGGTVAMPTAYPTIKFKAYVIQAATFMNATDAWTAVKSN